MQRSVDLIEMAFGLAHQRTGLGTLVGNGLTFRVVLVVAVGVPGGVDDTGVVVLEPRQPLLGRRPLSGEQLLRRHCVGHWPACPAGWSFFCSTAIWW